MECWHDNWMSEPMNRQTGGWIIAGLIVATPLWASELLDGLVDPSRPSSQGAVSTVVHQGGLVLQSTFVSPSQRVAVISGQRLAVGDRVQGATVTDIQPYQVTLQRAGRDIALRLTPPLAKEKR